MTDSQVWVVNCDGASRGNPGPASIGVVVRDPQGVVRRRIGLPLGRATNNYAEYRAAITGLEAVLALGATDVELRLDSELIVRQLQGRYRVRHPDLMPLFELLQALSRRFRRFAVNHVPRAQNKDADALANAALDGKPVGDVGDDLSSPASNTATPDAKALPRLKGSPKQVNWANRIREGKLHEVEQVLRLYPTEDPVIRVEIERGLDELRSQTSAKWWIESRDKPVQELIEGHMVR